MNNKYNSLKELINFWENYEDQTGRSDFQGFADWLPHQIASNPELIEKVTINRLRNPQSLFTQNLKNYDEQTRFLELISRLARLHEFYTKKFLEGLPINNRLEFLFLHTINTLGRAKKTELISFLLVEYTTGIDTIKRLVNNNLVSEGLNENDKRAKLLEVTLQGKEILSLSEKRLKEERAMFLACINTNKWKKTMPFLEEIYDFHNTIYNNHIDKPYPELLNLMDSLKHLHR